MTSIDALAVRRRCLERIEGTWTAFLTRRRELLAQAERHGSAPERVTEQILSTLFSDVLDWPIAHVNYQLGWADIVLTSPGVRWVVVEAKRPGKLAWHRRAIDDALDQVCRYADQQNVHVVAISDGQMFYAADRVHGGLQDRVFIDLAAEGPPKDLWWMSVHGVYRRRDDLDAARLRLLPEAPREMVTNRSEDAQVDGLLHPRYKLPARCFAYVGNAADTRSWKLPYRTQAGAIDLKRLPGAINAVLKSYRGVRVDIPEAAIPDVLVRLARAAKMAGRFDGTLRDEPANCYELLAVILEQEGRLSEV